MFIIFEPLDTTMARKDPMTATAHATEIPAAEKNLFIRRIWSLYGAFIFLGLFVALFPAFLIPILIPRLYWLTYYLNRFWAFLFLGLIGLPVRFRYEAPFPKAPYIICANHFSYLDIAVLGLSRANLTFMGKSELSKVPLFGFMYRKLHITVNRGNLRSRYESLQRAAAIIRRGYNIAIFPEGGIVADNPPRMARFKDGAFRLAIEQQIPVVPVTIPHNWVILPDDERFILRYKRPEVIYHAPVHTKGLTMEDLSALKQQVYRIIDKELQKYYPDESR